MFLSCFYKRFRTVLQVCPCLGLLNLRLKCLNQNLCFRFKNSASLFLDCISKWISNYLFVFFLYKLVFLIFLLICYYPSPRPPAKKSTYTQQNSLYSELRVKKIWKLRKKNFQKTISPFLKFVLFFHFIRIHVFGSKMAVSNREDLLKLTGYLLRYFKGRKLSVWFTYFKRSIRERVASEPD